MNWPSRYSHINTCIDLIFSNCKYVMQSSVADVNISDHQAVFIACKHIPKIKIKLNLQANHLSILEKMYSVKTFWDMTGITYLNLMMYIILHGTTLFQRLFLLLT